MESSLVLSICPSGLRSRVNGVVSTLRYTEEARTSIPVHDILCVGSPKCLCARLETIRVSVHKHEINEMNFKIEQTLSGKKLAL